MLKNAIFLRFVAGLAMLFGLLTTITGSRALSGSFSPGYATFPLLIGYNVLLGIASMVTAYLIWTRRKLALLFSAFIASAHTIVFVSLVSVFSESIAPQSVEAMIFRSLLWIVIFLYLNKFADYPNKQNIK